jgi:hypothetical protein
VDEVHPGQDILEQLQDAQGHAEEKLLPIPAEYVPDRAGQVQGQGLGEQGGESIDQIDVCYFS